MFEYTEKQQDFVNHMHGTYNSMGDFYEKMFSPKGVSLYLRAVGLDEELPS